MNWRTTARLLLGTILSLLGLLWILQGVDVVRIQPVLCAADCQPITGGSIGWLTAGVVTVVLGLIVLLRPSVVSALRRRR